MNGGISPRGRSGFGLAVLLAFLAATLLSMPHEVADGAAQCTANSNLHAELRQLLQEGNYASFISRVCDPRFSPLRDSDLLRLKAEGLLASGRLREAGRAALAAAQAAHDPKQTAAALKLWSVARFRERQPLDLPEVARLLSQTAASPALAAIHYWRDKLDRRRPFQFDANAKTIEVDLKESLGWTRLYSHRVEGVELSLDGVKLPLAFIDTGAEHTIITSQAARAAGLEVAPQATELVGFASAPARPALVRELNLGGLVIRNVPVYVCDSESLLAAKGQAALGIDLLHHLRVTIDYPRHLVRVEPVTADARLRKPTQPDNATWQIQLWTFSHSSLTSIQLPDGKQARTLIDTCNRAGTYLSPRWAAEHLPNFRQPISPLLPWFKRRKLELVGLELAGRPLSPWPVNPNLPRELDNLDLFDLLVGLDLLGSWCVTIDLSRQRLELRPSE